MCVYIAVYNLPRWRAARIFVSSPFRDFHGERDVIVRHVVPELRRRGQRHFISVSAVDLRWGVSEQDTKLNRYSRCTLHNKFHLIRLPGLSLAQYSLTVQNCNLKHLSFHFIGLELMGLKEELIIFT